MNSVRAITLLLKHLLAGKTSCLIAELKTIYKMAPFLEAQVKESSCSAGEKLSFFCVMWKFHLRDPGVHPGEGVVPNNAMGAHEIGF